jgi:hypothetical protein
MARRHRTSELRQAGAHADGRATPVADGSMDVWIDEAFRRFGRSRLWNVRRPDVADPAIDLSAERIARRLMREGGGDAVNFGSRMLAALEVDHAGRIPDRGHSLPGDQPQPG